MLSKIPNVVLLSGVLAALSMQGCGGESNLFGRRNEAGATAVDNAVKAAKSWLAGATRSATVAADSAAVADIGPTIRWRELPKSLALASISLP